MRFLEKSEAYQIKYVNGDSVTGTEEKSTVNGVRLQIAKNAKKMTYFSALNTSKISELLKGSGATVVDGTLQVAPANKPPAFQVEIQMNLPKRGNVRLLLKALLSQSQLGK